MCQDSIRLYYVSYICRFDENKDSVVECLCTFVYKYTTFDLFSELVSCFERCSGLGSFVLFLMCFDV